MRNTEVAVRGRVVADRYVVGRELGRGGMGVVCEAFDSRLERKVAIKILDPISARKPEAIRRFHREALAAGRIGHENICDVRDRGVTADGLPFIVMELLVGEPLSRIVEREAPLAPARAVRVMLQVLAALRAAHEAGIIHRDLKPGNVFIVTDADGNERVKLVDFGISRFQVDVSGGEVTMTGTVMGTPRYMSPEQARGKSDVDHRADLWSVGVMLYEAVIGERPFSGENYNEMMFAIVGEEPKKPSALLPGIPPALEKAILRAMAKDKDARHGDAGELAAELTAALPELAEEPPPMRPRAATPGPVKRSSPSAATLVGEHPAAPRPGPPSKDAVTLVGPKDAPAASGDAVERATPTSPTLRGGEVKAVADEEEVAPLGAEDLLELEDDGGEGEDRHAVRAPPRVPVAPQAARRKPWLVGAVAAVLLGLVVGGTAVVLASREGGAEGPTRPLAAGRSEKRAALPGEPPRRTGGSPSEASPRRVRVPLKGLPAGATATFAGEPVRGGELEGPEGRTAELEVLANGFAPLRTELTLAEGVEVDLAGRLSAEAEGPRAGVADGGAKAPGPGKRDGRAAGERPPTKGPRGEGSSGRPGGAFVKGRHGTKITLEYGNE